MEKGKRKKEKEKHRKLTGRELSFCSHYIQCGKNPSEAFKLSSYKSDNMKPQTIASKAYKLLQKDYIRDMIDKLNKEVMKQVKDETAFGLEDTVKGIIALAKKGKAENTKVKAFDMLMKHFGGYEKDNEQGKSEVNIPITHWVSDGGEGTEEDFNNAFDDID